MNPDNTKRFWRTAARIGRYATMEKDGAKVVPPIIFTFEARLLLQTYYGGFWRMLWALVQWQWREAWALRHRLVNAWIWWADRTGRYVFREGERHATDCVTSYAVEASSQEGVDDDCLRRAAPRWIQRWM